MHASTLARPRADEAVWAIISFLPPGRYTARDAAWQQAFAALQGEFADSLPGLRSLEFHRSEGVVSISDELDQMLQMMDASILAPAFDVLILEPSHHPRHFSSSFTPIEQAAAFQASQRLHALLSQSA